MEDDPRIVTPSLICRRCCTTKKKFVPHVTAAVLSFIVFLHIMFSSEQKNIHLFFSYRVDDVTTTTTKQKRSNHDDDDDDVSTFQSSSSIPPAVIIKPPYQIVEFGEERSGSTFMQQLLYAVVRVKTPPDQNVSMLAKSLGSREENFVTKSHKEIPDLLHQIERRSDISVFVSTKDIQNMKYSTNVTSKALYIQESDNLKSCSICEVDSYKGLFNLSDADVKNVKDYLSAFEVLRLCCGMQMSRWERMRLHGCNVTKEEKARPGYPNCESLNKTEFELLMASEPGGIKYIGMHPMFNWNQVGDCKRFDKMIIEGKDFNGLKFKSCDRLRRSGFGF